MSRKIEIDKEQFESLCALNCTEVEVCQVLKVCPTTLLKWCKRTYKCTFEEIYAEKSAAGKVSLRRMQFKSAKDGNVPMQIWLGKQWLGQCEKPSAADLKEEEKISDEVEALLAELDSE